MRKHHNPLLIQYGPPYLIEIMCTKQIDDGPQIRPYVYLVDRYLRPRICEVFLHLFIGVLDEFEVVKIVEKDFHCRVQSQLEVPEQW